jgi:hypothetical protein
VHRLLVCLLLASAAGPALAQVPFGAPPGVQAGDYANQVELDRQRMVALENELNARDAARRAEAAVRTLAPPPLPLPLAGSSTTGGHAIASASSGASIPDDRLAASNARVRAAADNRR